MRAPRKKPDSGVMLWRIIPVTVLTKKMAHRPLFPPALHFQSIGPRPIQPGFSSLALRAQKILIPAADAGYTGLHSRAGPPPPAPFRHSDNCPGVKHRCIKSRFLPFFRDIWQRIPAVSQTRPGARIGLVPPPAPFLLGGRFESAHAHIVPPRGGKCIHSGWKCGIIPGNDRR